jgi:RNA polymerase sigma-70 factor (sigma-E family)
VTIVRIPVEPETSVRPVEDFDSYVRASGPRMKRLAFLLTGNLEAAEDLLQASYAKVLPRWDRIARYDQPDAYLRTVMVNTQRSWWRRLRGRELLTGEPPDVRRPGGQDFAADVDARQELLEALRALPDRQRTAVVLRHYCDLSEAEVASVMRCSVGTVKSNTSRGLVALRIELSVPLAGREGAE